MEGSDNVSSPGHEITDAAALQAHVAACLEHVRQVAHAEQRQDLEAAIDSELQHLKRQDPLTVVVAAEVRWWHCVKALETSASLSFTNFLYSNSYKWAKPKIKF